MSYGRGPNCSDTRTLALEREKSLVPVVGSVFKSVMSEFSQNLSEPPTAPTVRWPLGATLPRPVLPLPSCAEHRSPQALGAPLRSEPRGGVPAHIAPQTR